MISGIVITARLITSLINHCHDIREFVHDSDVTFNTFLILTERVITSVQGIKYIDSKTECAIRGEKTVSVIEDTRGRGIFPCLNSPCQLLNIYDTVYEYFSVLIYPYNHDRIFRKTLFM